MGYTGDREERITGRTARRGATGGARLGGQVWEGKDGGGGGREVAAERQRQNATNSKRAEPCACIRNAIGPLSTGARPPPFVSRGGQGGGGWGGRGERAELPPEPVAGKF